MELKQGPHHDEEDGSSQPMYPAFMHIISFGPDAPLQEGSACFILQMRKLRLSKVS